MCRDVFKGNRYLEMLSDSLSPLPLGGHQVHFESSLPTCGGGTGRGVRSKVIDFRTDCHDNMKDSMDICENIIVPESQDLISLIFEPGVTYLVPVDLIRMLSSVELYYDSFLEADEVNYVRSNRLLPSEFQAGEPFCPQISPEEAFCIGGSLSQRFCMLGSDFRHAPLPDPLPQGERGPVIVN